MQIISSPCVVEKANGTIRAILQTYLSPNKTFEELAKLIGEDAENPLREFSVACRGELQSRHNGYG